MGFPEIGGTLFEGPHNKDYSVFGSNLHQSQQNAGSVSYGVERG